MITNQKVYDALTNCIEERWELHAESLTGFDDSASLCALCNLFEGYIISQLKPDRSGNRSSRECRRCPIFIHNNGKGCAHKSLYSEWIEHPTQRKAQAMLESLREIKQLYFGDW